MSIFTFLWRVNPDRVFRKLFEPEFDPARAARVYREFDESRGYRAYHELCKSRFKRQQPGDTASTLVDAGFQYVDVMDSMLAERLLERATAESPVSYLKRDTRNLEGYRIRDPAMVRELLEATLPKQVDALLTQFFCSEYLVHWFTLSRTAPAAVQNSISFRWHCDRGPKAHLKLLVYLNGAETHGGGTALLNLVDTALLAEKGYLFGRGRKRTVEIGDLSRLAGRDIVPDLRPMRAGEGIVFQPATTLHSGISPRSGPRFVLTLCLLPSPVHWKEALQCGTMTDLTEQYLWHSHASELLRRMEKG